MKIASENLVAALKLILPVSGVSINQTVREQHSKDEPKISSIQIKS